MTTLLMRLENTARRGADGLSAEARAAVAEALLGLQAPDGGFAGLDGRSDPYYSFFAWLSLRAVGVPFAREPFLSYLGRRSRDAGGVGALAARLALAAERGRAPGLWTAAAGALGGGFQRGAYGAFLLLLAAGRTPRVLARLAWARQRRMLSAGAGRLPTPRLAAALALAAAAEADGASLADVLAARRCATGGFASAPGACPDLLATAVARFSLALARPPDGVAAGSAADLAFIESCWLEDGLFGPSPLAERGDAEHTFYGLLALGTCR